MVSQRRKTFLCLIVDSGKIGGIESHVVLLARYLVRNNYAVKVIFLNNYSGQAIPNQLEKFNIPIVFLDGRFKSFLKMLREEKPDLLHAHGYKPGVFSKLSRFFTSIPVIC